MNNLLIEGVDKEALETLIYKTMRRVFDELELKEQGKPKEKNYLSRKETANLLKISLVTLNTLTASGKLTSYRIGKRILYKEDEVEQALTQIYHSKT